MSAKRRSIGLFLAEDRRDMAEIHAQKMDEDMARVESLAAVLEKEVRQTRKEKVDLENIVLQLKNDLAAAYSENIELQEKLEYTEQSLQEKIKSLNVSLHNFEEQLNNIGGDGRSITPIGNKSSSASQENQSRYPRATQLSTNRANFHHETKANLRQEKARLSKQIADLLDENKKYANDLRQEISKRHSLQLLGVIPQSRADSSMVMNESEDISSDLVIRAKRAEENYRLLRAKSNLMYEAYELLHKKFETQQDVIAKLTEDLSQREFELNALKEKLSQYHDKLLIENVMKLEIENKKQAEELMLHRVQVNKAIAADNDLRTALSLSVQYLQLLNPHASMEDSIRSWKDMLAKPSSIQSIADLSQAMPSTVEGKGSIKSKSGSRVYFDISEAGNAHADNKVDEVVPASQSLKLKDMNLDSNNTSTELTLSQSGKLFSRANMIFNLLAPVVEDRLLRNIYARYNIADSGNQSNVAVMGLTRFVRFAREFGFVSSTGTASVGKYLVAGEVDMVFFNASKIVVDAPSADNSKPNHTRPFCVRHHFVSYTGLLSVYPSNESMFLAHEASAEVASDTDSISQLHFNKFLISKGTDSNKFQPISSTTVVTQRQFMSAVEQLAIKLFAKDIEKKVGTVYECLPQSEKPAAARYALELAYLRKIIPMADRLDIIPWSLIYFDQALTSLSLKDINYNILSSLKKQLLEWFNYYLSNFDVLSGEPYYDNEASETKESHHSFNSPSLLSETVIKLHNRLNSTAAKQPTWNSDVLSYKLFSRFGREFGIIPYLIKESQMFSIFQEVILWGRTSSSLILETLPSSVIVNGKGKFIELGNAKLFDSVTVSVKPFGQKQKNGSTSTKQTIMGLTMAGFSIAVLSIAAQAFHEKPIEERMGELLKWMSKNQDNNSQADSGSPSSY